MQNWATFARRYQVFLHFLDFQQRLLPIPLAFSLAARSAEHFSPHRELQATVSSGMRNALGLSEADIQRLWQRYLRHAGTADLLTFMYRRMTPDWLGRYIHINSDFEIDASLSTGRSVFLMTYHNHYPHFLAAVMGLLQHKTYLVAMDYKNSPLYAYLPTFADAYHAHCASHFNGGKYLLMQQQMPIAMMRTVFQALNTANVLVSLNDFPSPFTSKRNFPIKVFEQHYHVPTGTLEIAIKQQAQLAVGWVRGAGRGQFQVEIRALQGHTLEEVMIDYLRQLHNMVEIDPALWEGWKWLPA